MNEGLTSQKASLALFSHLVSLPEEEIDLAEAALVFAESEHPDLPIAYYMGMLDDLGAEAKRVVSTRRADPEARLRGLCDWFFDAQGFHGNEEAYYDPRNSYLNEVLDRRTGIPITLALVLLEVASRAGVEARGISFPGHFLVRAGAPERPIIVDAFHGRVLGPAEIETLASRAGADPQTADPRKLPPCGKRSFLFRMLTNLRGIHENRNDVARLRNVLEHLVAIAPSPDLHRALERLGGSGARGLALSRRISTRSLN
jgi:regulator of sirC expression with transglutaminase-like and TPR domain